MNRHLLSSSMSCVLSLAASALLLAIPARAAEPAAGPATDAANAPNVVRTYDVRNVLIAIPDFTDAPDLSVLQDQDESHPLRQPPDLFSGGQAEPAGMSRQEHVAKFIEWISATITPEAWKSGGAIRELNGTLTVVAPPETQQALAALFAELHRRQNVQITLETRMMVFSAADFKNLTPALALKVNAAAFPFGAQVPVRITDKEFSLLLRAVENSSASTFITAPRLTLFNGQQAYIVVSQQRAFVGSYIPRKDGSGFDPKVRIAESGVMLDVQATASDDQKQIAVHVVLQQSELKGMDTAEFDGAPPGKKLMIEVPIRHIRELRATAAVPNDEMVLVGRVREISESRRVKWYKPEAKAPSGGERVIMLVKATVINEKD